MCGKQSCYKGKYLNSSQFKNGTGEYGLFPRDISLIIQSERSIVSAIKSVCVCSLPGVVLSTKTGELKVFFHVFEQLRYGMNASLSLKANTWIIFGCSAIFFLPLLFRLVSIK